MSSVSLWMDDSKITICDEHSPQSTTLFCLHLKFEGKKFCGAEWDFCSERLEGTITSHCFKDQMNCLNGGDSDIYRRWKKNLPKSNCECVLATLTDCYSCSKWHFFCLGVCLTMILYQLVEDCRVSAPFPIWIPKPFLSGIFDKNILSYFNLVALGLQSLGCPPLNSMGLFVSQFCNTFQTFFAEGSLISIDCLLKQTIDITTAACQQVVCGKRELENHKQYINSHLSSLETKINYRIDTLFRRLQREVNNTTIDLQHKINTRLPPPPQETGSFCLNTDLIESGFTFPLTGNEESGLFLSSLK